MAELKLVSGGDVIKLWDAGGYSELKQFNPHSGNISSLSWSTDNTAVASASTTGDKIVVTWPNANHSIDEAVGNERTCLALNSSSRYVAGGGPDGIVHVYDLKHHKLRRSYENHKSPVTCVQFNSNDTVLASSSEAGEIILSNVLSGVAYTPLVQPSKQAVRHIQYSYFKKSLLAAASDDRSVTLWDTSAKRLLHQFDSIHKAPTTAVCFSPVNDILLLSIGLDKKIVCYDLNHKTSVKTMQTEGTLTSIDMLYDGATLVVGTTRGRLYTYDLRQGDKPVRSIIAHKSSVQSVKFQANLKTKSEVGGIPSSVKSTSKLPSSSNTSRSSSTSLTNQLNNNNNIAIKVTQGDGDQTTDLSNGNMQLGRGNIVHKTSLIPGSSVRAMSSVGDDVFSPVRDAGLHPAVDRLSKEGLEIRHGRSPLANDNTSSNNFAVGVFSPLTDGTYERESPIGGGGDRPFATRHTTDLAMPSLDEQDAGSAEDFFTSQDQEEPPTSHTTERLDKIFSQYNDKGHHNFYSNHGEPTESATVMSFGSPGRSTPPASSHKAPHPFPFFPPHKDSTTPEAMPSQGEAVAMAAQASGTVKVTEFHTELLRNIVREELDEFKDKIENQLMNLHMTLIKQFLKQEDVITQLVSHYSVNDDLLSEVERLQEENARLKKRF